MPHIPQLDDHCRALEAVCAALRATRDLTNARSLAAAYPHTPTKPFERSYTEYDKTRLFVRDGFINRYSGNRLVFPGTLRLLALLLPDEFPYHPNWKVEETHPMFWELCATVDHVAPVTRGGVDQESNWVTTSLRLNQAKAQWTLDELGWTLQPTGHLNDWDGLSRWFLDFLSSHPKHLEHPYIKSWHSAAKRVLG